MKPGSSLKLFEIPGTGGSLNLILFIYLFISKYPRPSGFVDSENFQIPRTGGSLIPDVFSSAQN
jgi:hypothetical protein